MLKKIIITLIGLAAIIALPASHAQEAKAWKTARSSFSPQSDLRANMRKLWTDHVSYTRNFITSSLAGLEDTDAVTKRLLRNQDDIGNAIKPIYGKEAGDKLAVLLRDHILIAAEITNAAKAGNNEAVSAGKERGRRNAGDIARLLSGANPNWSEKQVANMLFSHLDYVIAQVTARLKKDWAGDIEANDKGLDHMLMFADVLANGIVKQFPKKFPR